MSTSETWGRIRKLLTLVCKLNQQTTDNKRVYVFDLSGSAYGYNINHIWRSDRQIKGIIIKKGQSDPNKRKMQQNSSD